MKIGIDIDDTICNTTATALAHGYAFCLENNLSVADFRPHLYSLQDTFSWDEATEEIFWQKYHDKIIAQVDPFPLATETFAKLRAQGHQLHLITARPPTTDSTVQITKSWLEKHHFTYDQLCHNIQQKDLTCKDLNIDLFIDDLPNHCQSVANCQIKTFIFDRVYNQDFSHPGATRVYNWPQIATLIEKLTQT